MAEMAIGDKVSESFSHWRGETLAVRVRRRKISSSDAVAGPTAISRCCLGSTSSWTCVLPDSTEITWDWVWPPARTATFTFCFPRSLSEICEASSGTINRLIVFSFIHWLTDSVKGELAFLPRSPRRTVVDSCARFSALLEDGERYGAMRHPH